MQIFGYELLQIIINLTSWLSSNFLQIPKIKAFTKSLPILMQIWVKDFAGRGEDIPFKENILNKIFRKVNILSIILRYIFYQNRSLISSFFSKFTLSSVELFDSVPFSSSKIISSVFAKDLCALLSSFWV